MDIQALLFSKSGHSAHVTMFGPHGEMSNTQCALLETRRAKRTGQERNVWRCKGQNTYISQNQQNPPRTDNKRNAGVVWEIRTIPHSGNMAYIRWRRQCFVNSPTSHFRQEGTSSPVITDLHSLPVGSARAGQQDTQCKLSQSGCDLLQLRPSRSKWNKRILCKVELNLFSGWGCWPHVQLFSFNLTWDRQLNPKAPTGGDGDISQVKKVTSGSAERGKFKHITTRH